MKTGTKIAIAGGTLLFLGAWAWKKKNDYSEVITKMSMNIDKFRNLRTKNSKMYFDCDVEFKNNTAIDFAPAGLIGVKRINVFYKGKLLGIATKETPIEFSLLANGTQIIKNVEVELLSLNIIDQLLGDGLDSNPANYTIQVELFALGNYFIIEQ